MPVVFMTGIIPNPAQVGTHRRKGKNLLLYECKQLQMRNRNGIIIPQTRIVKPVS